MKLQNFVGDFGRDPVLRSAKLALFCFITQVDTAYQLDTARPRYDDDKNAKLFVNVVFF